MTTLRWLKALALVVNRRRILSRSLPARNNVYSNFSSRCLCHRTESSIHRPTCNMKSYHLFDKAEKTSLFSSIPSSICFSQRVRSSPEHIDQDILKLDSDVRKTGRLSEFDVQKVAASIKLLGTVTSNQALLLIRCCGSLIPEMQWEERTKLVEDIWNMLLGMQCTFDASHYNALLKVYLENEHKFDPNGFLKNMEEKGVQPNRVTYQRLLSRYCQDGDIQGASEILELMKSKDFPLNEAIFNELIMGHGRARNMEDTAKILDVMNNAGLPLSSSTFTALACGYAITGDMENVLSTIQQADSQGASLQDKDILKVIYTLTVHNNAHLVEQILPKLDYKHGFSHHCINIVLELVNKGHHQIGFTLLNSMPKELLGDGPVKSAGIQFIRQLIKESLPTDVVIDYCNKLKEREMTEVALLKAIEMCNLLQKPDEAVPYLKSLHSQNFKLRQHYFWPTLVSKKGNDKEIYDVLKMMMELDCPANFDTFLDYVFPYIATSDPFLVVTKLKDIGYEVHDILDPLSVFILLNGDTKTAAQLLEKYPVKVHASRALANAYTKSQDTSSAVKILQHFKMYPVISGQHVVEKDIYGLFLSDLVIAPGCNGSLVKAMLTVMKEKDMKISHSALQTITANLGNCLNAETIPFQLLESLVSSDVPPLYTGNAELEPSPQIPLNMSLEDLEAYLVARRAKGQRLIEVLHRLLVQHARKRNLQRVEEIIKELDEYDFIYRGATLAVIMELYTYHDDVEKAMHYKRLLEELYPNFLIDYHKIINLASLLAENKKFDDAEAVISLHYSKFGSNTHRKGFQFNIFQLLNAFTQSEDPDRTRKLFEMLLDYGYCKPENVVLGPLVKHYILRNDIEGAVKEFLRIVSAYNVTPWKNELFVKLIELEDASTLQKVVDASITVHGETNTLFDLGNAFAACGKLQEAKKIFQTPGFQAKTDRINSVCARYLEENKIKELESLVKITKDVHGLDRDHLYYHLLRAYAKSEDVEKAMGIWVEMQEEDVQPSVRTLIYLGNFLKHMNQPVPFAIPQDFTGSPINCSALKEILTSTNLDSRLSTELRVKLDNETMEPVDYSKIIALFLENDMLEEAFKLSTDLLSNGHYPTVTVARLLASKLSEVGDSNKLLQLQRSLPQKVVKFIPINDYLSVSSIKMGQAEEFLKSLESDFTKHKDDFPETSVLTILEDDPSLLSRINDIAEKYYSMGTPLGRNTLWSYYMNKKSFKEAREIFKSTPEMQIRIHYGSVLKRIKDFNDVELSQELFEQVMNSSLQNRPKGVICSSHINVLLSVRTLDEAVKCFDEAKRAIGLGDLSRGTLFRLKEHLDQAGRIVHFNLPADKKDRSKTTEML